jgi:hypothetical protein
MVPYLFFTYLEAAPGGLVSDFLGYCSDPWNIVDFLIIVLTTAVQLLFSICCFYEEEVFSI